MKPNALAEQDPQNKPPLSLTLGRRASVAALASVQLSSGGDAAPLFW